MKIILILLAIGEMSLFGQVLGVNYDESYVLRLKSSTEEKGKKILKGEAGDLKVKEIEASATLKGDFLKKVEALFNKDSNFENGLGDVRFQPYAMVFFKEGEVVLVVSPNVLGGDLYATDDMEIGDSRSLSQKQIREFLMICHMVFGTEEVRKGFSRKKR